MFDRYKYGFMLLVITVLFARRMSQQGGGMGLVQEFSAHLLTGPQLHEWQQLVIALLGVGTGLLLIFVLRK